LQREASGTISPLFQPRSGSRWCGYFHAQ